MATKSSTSAAKPPLPATTGFSLSITSTSKPLTITPRKPSLTTTPARAPLRASQSASTPGAADEAKAPRPIHSATTAGAVPSTPTGAVPSTPSGMSRSTVWNDEVEEAYRFQLAGWRDAAEYATVKLINLKTVRAVV